MSEKAMPLFFNLKVTPFVAFFIKAKMSDHKESIGIVDNTRVKRKRPNPSALTQKKNY